MDNKQIHCPVCGQLIDLKPMASDPRYVIAFHNCGTGQMRAVYMTDAPHEPVPAIKSKTKEA